MKLIERYLQAVRFWLPERQKQDIIAELSEDIHAQVEEQEVELNRPLNETELAAILKQRGAPVLVANRYLPQECLIGPLLFPIYRFVLKMVVLFYLVPWVLVWIGLSVFGPIDPAGQAGHSWSAHLGAFWGSFWLTTFMTLGAVTLVFAVLERVNTKTCFLEKWDPRKLPPVRDPNRIARSASSIELVANLVFAAWWITCMSSPIVLRHPELQISLSPLWPYFYWGFLLLALGNTVFAGVNLMRPYSTTLRATLRLLSDCAGSVLFCWLLKANILAGFIVANVPPAKSLEFTNAINWWTAKMFPFAVVVCVVILVVDAFRIARVRSRNLLLARATTVVMTMLLLAGGGSAQTFRQAVPPSRSVAVEVQRGFDFRINVQTKHMALMIELVTPVGRAIVALGSPSGSNSDSSHNLVDSDRSVVQ